MKRAIWSGVAVLILAVAAAIPTIAQAPQGRGPGRGMGGAPMPMLRGLDLTDAQREQVRSIAAEQRSGTENPGRKVAELEQQLRLAVFADSPDLQKIDELKTAIAAANAEALTARIDLESRIAQVLTAEQRAKARETMTAAGARRGPGFGARRGRGGV